MFAQLLTFVTLCALSAPALAKPSISPLVNGDFETCVDGAAPTGWQQGGTGTASQPIVLCSSTRRHSGKYSALFVPFSVTGQGNKLTYVGELSQTVAFLEAGQPITLTYWVNFADVPQGVDPSTTGTYDFTVTYNNDANSRIEINPTVVPGTGTASTNFFYQFTATFNAPSKGSLSGTLTIAFQSNQPSINIYLDDVALTAPLIAGDPSFVGLRGQQYQVHGIDGEVYNLVSSSTTQVNARFVFLDEGVCPMFNGVPAENCWSHPGSYLGAIGVQQRVGKMVHSAIIEAGSARQGIASVIVDGKALDVSESFADSDAFNVTYVSSHTVRVQTEQFVFMFENSDMFINQVIQPRVPLSLLKSHGLFGQTHKAAIYPTALKYIEGEVDDYLVNDADLLGSDFVYNHLDN